MSENHSTVTSAPVANYSLQDILGQTLSREEALASIRSDPKSLSDFLLLSAENKEKILSFIQGNQGIQIMHDTFSQKILDPSLHPERLEDLLSALLDTQVHIRSVLPREGNRMSEGGSLVIMDFVAELSNGTIIDVEIQQVGYEFPGERSDCYISDIIMRQYNAVRSQRGKNFSFRDMNPVILIILMKNSSSAFSETYPHYIHQQETTYSSGASVKSLSSIIYVSLDTFHCVVQNITTKLDAWLMFLSSDRPADIMKLVNAYPEFLTYYQDIMEFRRKPKELLHMFSEALAIMDRNTELYMIDEMKKERAKLEQETTKLKQDNDVLKQDNDVLKQDNDVLKQDNNVLKQDNNVLKQALTEKENEIALLKTRLTQTT